MISDVTDLEIYQESLKLLRELYDFLKYIPTSEFDTIVQFKKAGKSIPSNIAEGYAKKNSEKEFKRFLRMALGSSDEIISHFRIITITVPKLSQRAKTLAFKYKNLSKKINKLCKIWKTFK